MGDRYSHPSWAFAFSLLGGLLIFIVGVYIGAIAGAAVDAGYYEAGSILNAIGTLGVILGLVIVLLAVALWIRPQHHVGYGIGILVLSLVSLFAGAGLFLGLILGVIGGIMAIVWEDPDEADDLPPWPSAVPSWSTAVPSWPSALPAASAAPFPRTPPPPPGLAPFRACPSCRKVIDRKLTVCSSCGAALTPA